jgi:hypothetical protein
MTFGGSPFSPEAIRKGLGPDHVAAADVSAQHQRNALDEQELRDLERTEYYGDTPAVIDDATPSTRTRKSIIDRLLRR